MMYLYLALLVTALIYAVRRGGTAERWVALTYIFGAVATPIVSQARFVGVEWGIMAVDALMLVSLIAVTARFEWSWLLWITALQLILVASHFARSTGGSATPFGYAWLVSAIAYPMIGLLIFGTYRHCRRANAGNT